MTPEQQRIVIAEACGWKHTPEHDVTFNTPAGKVMPEMWRIEHLNGDTEAACFDGLPDYLTDLNAMHEAEKLLTDDQYYMHFLPFLGAFAIHDSVCISRCCASATASQRAEAFLRTLNLWTP